MLRGGEVEERVMGLRLRTVFMYMCLCLLVSMDTMCKQYPWRPEEGVGASRPGPLKE